MPVVLEGHHQTCLYGSELFAQARRRRPANASQVAGLLEKSIWNAFTRCSLAQMPAHDIKPLAFAPISTLPSNCCAQRPRSQPRQRLQAKRNLLWRERL